jgi:hypothetical protein
MAAAVVAVLLLLAQMEVDQPVEMVVLGLHLQFQDHL